MFNCLFVHLKTYYIYTNFRFITTLTGRYRKFPRSPHMHRLSVIDVTHWSSIFLTKEDPTLSHHPSPNSVVHVRILSWSCPFHTFWKMSNGMDPSLWCHTEKLNRLKNLLCSACSPFPHVTPGDHWSFAVSVVVPFPECPRVEIPQCVAFFRRASLTEKHAY